MSVHIDDDTCTLLIFVLERKKNFFFLILLEKMHGTIIVRPFHAFEVKKRIFPRCDRIIIEEKISRCIIYGEIQSYIAVRLNIYVARAST